MTPRTSFPALRGLWTLLGLLLGLAGAADPAGAAADSPERPEPRPRLQVLNGSGQALQVFRLGPDGRRSDAGAVTVPAGREAFLDTAIGGRFLLVGHGSPDGTVVTSTVPVQAVRFDPPDPHGIPAFYTQRTDAHGYPIVASAKVNPYALREAAFLVDRMLAKRPDIRTAMILSGSRLCILARDEFTTDQPEFARLADVPMPERPDLSGRDYWDSRARGLGGSETDPFCSCGEENLLAFPGDPYAAENILIHEFAHNIHLRGLVNVDPTFDGRLRAAYDAAMKAGLWKGKYAAVNHHEYFAEGVQSWFDDNREDDHDHNHVNTRRELVEYDPGLAALCREVFGDTELRYTKPQTRVAGHLAGWDPAASPRFEWPERLRRPRPSSATTPPSPVVGGLGPETRLGPRAAGTVLLGELSCTACHATGRPGAEPKGGPDLSDAGSRLGDSFLRGFLAQPSAVHPGTTMPDILGGLPAKERDAAAAALAAYLTSLRREAAPTSSVGTGPGDPARGEVLFRQVGCAACHRDGTPASGPVPLGPLASKHTAAGLAAFLLDPLAVRPSARMPDLRLDPAEARDLAAHLLRDAAPVPTGTPAAPDPGLVRQGRELFVRHRCAACHRTGEALAAAPAKPLGALDPDRGCLSGKTGGWPSYPLSGTQRTAIRAALPEPSGTPDPTEALGIALTRWNCIACHRREGLGGPSPERSALFTGTDPNLGESGRLPPPLTGVGAKLRPAALRDTVANGRSVRPYLHTRMPRFGPEAAGPLAEALREVDTLPALSIRRVEPEDKPHDAGRRLAGTQGLNCIACHTFRGQGASPLRALDLMSMAERLEESWFHRYLADPARFSPQTIMPSFWPDGKSPLPKLLGGDAERQRDALWQWLSQGPEAGEPQGLVLEPLRIEVRDEAVVVRRAFPGIGKRGIGVGYPSGIHLAFDAGQLRLGSLWSGGFIEASGLWRGQGAGQAHVLGRDRVAFPVGPAFAVLDSPDAPWPTNTVFLPAGRGFLGYTLDARRRPTFRYESAGASVEDRFLDVVGADGKPHFVRTLTPTTPPPAGLRFRVAADPSVVDLGGRRYAVGKGLAVVLSVDGAVRESAGNRELTVPVSGPFTVEYHLGDHR